MKEITHFLQAPSAATPSNPSASPKDKKSVFLTFQQDGNPFSANNRNQGAHGDAKVSI